MMDDTGAASSAQNRTAEAKHDFSEAQRLLVRTLRDEGIDDEAVLRTLGSVPRHAFLEPEFVPYAYQNRPLPIGYNQTISQPYIVALMTQLAQADEHDRVLEIGTGSGYQTAVLGQMAGEVYSVERVEALGKRAQRTLTRLGLGDNVHIRVGDGYVGWTEMAPFDAIVVTAAPPQVPTLLVDQLRVGGRLIIPIGAEYQELLVVSKTEAGTETESVIPVRFVPMIAKTPA